MRRRRRFQSLGLMRKSQNRQGRGPLEGVKRFVSESQLNDIILYCQVIRARPGIRQLQFANDDVDWHLEYFCEAIGKWMGRILGWILGIFEAFLRFLGFKRKKDGDGGDDINGKFFLNPVTPTSNLAVAKTSSTDGQGDCSPCLQDVEVFQYVNEKGSPATSTKDLSSSVSDSQPLVTGQSSDSHLKDSSFRAEV